MRGESGAAKGQAYKTLSRSGSWAQAGKSEGLIDTDDADGQHNLGGGKEPCFSREVFTWGGTGDCHGQKPSGSTHH